MREKGVSFEQVYYHETPLSKEKLAQLIDKMGISPRELLRTGEELYKELGIKDKEFADDELIALMREHPDLMQRPIAEKGEKAVLARPPEKILELL